MFARTNRIVLWRIVLAGFLVPVWVYLRSVYRDRLGAFGCFDDCFNIMAGYFIGQGKHLYSEIFFNHQPLPAYISYLIQALYHPGSIYELIYRHRMVLIGYFALADIFLTLRFGLVGFFFALLFESTKGFLFGERFLAESMIVYPLVYLLALVWQTWQRQRMNRFDLILASLAAWFVVFSREPYVPLALFLFAVIVYQTRSKIALLTFLFVALATLTLFDFRSYWWNVVTVNMHAAGQELGLSIFFYPFTVFFGGNWNLFRWIEVILSGLILLTVWRTGWKRALLVLLTLGLANVRAVEPGTLYYVAFHHLVWYAVAIFVVLLHIKRGWLAIGALALFVFLSPKSYLHEKVNRTDQFGIGYGHYIMQGEIIKRLAEPSDTLFLEEWDDLIYWQAKLPSAYRYSWYTSSMANFPIYRDARSEMFRDYPPDFYYGQCAKDGKITSLPDFRKADYIRLTQGQTPTCIFVKKTVAVQIPDDRWKSVRDFSIDKPLDNYLSVD